jgi:hypothetical protein
MTLLLVPLPKATGLATTDARTHLHHTPHTPDDGGVDGSHSVFVSNERASSAASLSDGESDLTTGFFSELATRGPLSSHTPATVILTTKTGPGRDRRPARIRKPVRQRVKSAQFRRTREDHSTTKTGPLQRQLAPFTGNQFHFVGEAEPFSKYELADLDREGINSPENLNQTLEEKSALYRE